MRTLACYYYDDALLNALARSTMCTYTSTVSVIFTFALGFQSSRLGSRGSRMESAEAHAVHTPMEDVRYSLVGHTSRCFDVCYNRDSSCILSGGEDGTAKMWTVPSAGAQGYTASPKLLHSLLHNKEAEVLRVSMGSKHDDDGDGR